MRLSVFYCISFTFLGCLIIYMSFKLPEYYKVNKSSKHNENNSKTAIDDEVDEIKIESLLNKKAKITEDFKNSSDTLLEEAIEEKEARELSDTGSKNKLERRRRFLIFPDGCSFQVVFCTTYFTIIPIADIFYLGLTAALAWELPKDPHIFFKQRKTSQRKDDGQLIYKDVKGSQNLNSWGNRVLVNRFTGQTIQPFSKSYYNFKQTEKNDKYYKKPDKYSKRKKIMRPPIFSKRSIENEIDNASGRRRSERASIKPADIEAMHREHEKRKYTDPEFMENHVIDFHRVSRYGLYSKLEKLITGLIGSGGRECILKALCEIKQDSNGNQGTFLDEILRAVFTLHKSSQHHTDYRHYDDMNHFQHKSCADSYSECSYSIKSVPMR